MGPAPNGERVYKSPLARLDALQKLLPTTRGRVIAVVGVAALLMAGPVSYFLFDGRGCSPRDDVTAHVSIASSKLQQAAAQGKIGIEQLAAGIRRLNAFATTYESTKDHQAYCDALDQLADEFS